MKLHFYIPVLILVILSCSNPNQELINALKNDADYGTISEILEKGADANAASSEGVTAIQLAHQMIQRSQQKINDIKNGTTTVAGGGDELILKQLESEKEHNQMILQLLQSQ